MRKSAQILETRFKQSKRPKLLHIASDTFKGGAESVFRHTIELSAQSDDFEVFSASCDKEIVGVKRHIILDDFGDYNRAIGAIKYIFNLKNFRILSSALNEIKPDIIHVQNYLSRLSPSVLFALKIYRAKNSRARLIFTEHSYSMCANHSFYDFRKQRVCEACLNSSAMKIAFRNCERRGIIYSLLKALRVPFYQGFLMREQNLFDKIIFVSEFQCQKHLQAGYLAQKLFVLQNPIDLDFLNEDVTLDEKQNVIMYYGRISEEKNISALICAFDELLRRGFKDYKLLIIGEGDELEKCQNLAQKSLNKDSFEFRTRLKPSELKKIIKTAKIVVIPSKCFETFGLVTVESILAGAIVVASNIGALRETIKSFGGFCFDLNDTNENYANFNSLDSKSESLAQVLQNVLNNYEENFADFCVKREKIIRDLKKQDYYERLKEIYLN